MQMINIIIHQIINGLYYYFLVIYQLSINLFETGNRIINSSQNRVKNPVSWLQTFEEEWHATHFYRLFYFNYSNCSHYIIILSISVILIIYQVSIDIFATGNRSIPAETGNGIIEDGHATHYCWIIWF